jgi:D-alanyl-D-alanine carboxypeptidase/D-alanyl-D-alanine-endopeptidase (penicillin-binding protein 4)
MRRFVPRLAVLAPLLLLLAPAAGIAKTPASAQGSLRNSLSRALRAAHGASGADVVDLQTARTLFSSAASVPRMPASVEKIYTTSTALRQFGAAGTLTTTVLGLGTRDAAGAWHGTLYLKGGGDPTFGSSAYDRYAYGTGATMQQLAADLAGQAGITSVQGALVGDDSYFDSLRGTPATGYAVSPDVEGLLSSLAYNRGLADPSGRSFQARPALFAAQHLAGALRGAHVSVPKGTPIFTGPAPPTAIVLAIAQSPPMATLAQLTNTPSDNFLAEMLLKGLGARFGGRGSTAAGAAVVRRQVAVSFGIHPRLIDGSGLSRYDRTSPRDVVRALSVLSTNGPFVHSLSVGGISGTMRIGLAGTAAQGRCRGKTGTLSNVANLVGYCTARDGHQLVFAFLMSAVDPPAGHALEDQMAVALAKYAG